MKYDPTVIEAFTRDLYSRASRIVIKYGLMYGLVGAPCGAVLHYYLPAAIAHDFGSPIVGAIIVLFALIGVSVGNDKAFALRLQAQLVMCQVQIERNTRTAAEVAATSAKAHLATLEATHLVPAVQRLEAGEQRG